MKESSAGFGIDAEVFPDVATDKHAAQGCAFQHVQATQALCELAEWRQGFAQRQRAGALRPKVLQIDFKERGFAARGEVQANRHGIARCGNSVLNRLVKPIKTFKHLSISAQCQGFFGQCNCFLTGRMGIAGLKAKPLNN